MVTWILILQRKHSLSVALVALLVGMTEADLWMYLFMLVIVTGFLKVNFLSFNLRLGQIAYVQTLTNS